MTLAGIEIAFKNLNKLYNKIHKDAHFQFDSFYFGFKFVCYFILRLIFRDGLGYLAYCTIRYHFK